jgi:hypothetical protein
MKLAGALLGALADGLVTAFNDWRTRQSLRREGALEALREHDKHAREAEKRMRAVDPPGVAGAVERLRRGQF